MDINPVQVILFLLGFGSILFLAYVASRYLAGKSNRAMRGKHMNIVESISLGLDKRLYLVKISGKHILLAVSSKRIEYLTAIDVESGEEAEEPQANRNVFDFRTLFEKYININKEKMTQKDKDGFSTDKAPEPEFRANLGRLRAMMQNTAGKEKSGRKDASGMGQKGEVEITNDE